MRLGVTLRKVEDLDWRHGYGDTVVEVSRPRHLGVDDQGRIPGISSTLGPHQVQRLQVDVGRGDPNITFISRIRVTVII